ncbi:MAG: PKD domain-containing protein [Bacteroidales bacterium]
MQTLPGSQDQWSTLWAHINLDAKPKAEFEVNINSVPTGSGVNFTDISKYEPTEWFWKFEGGTPSTSFVQNPQNIVYPESGVYDVTLIATNYLGSDTLLMENYIDANTTILPEVAFEISDSIPCSGEVVAWRTSRFIIPMLIVGVLS